MDTGAGRIERQFADRDAHAVSAEVAQAKNAFAIRHDDNSGVLVRPVLHYFLDPPFVLHRDVKAARGSIDVLKLLACLADRWRIDDRHHLLEIVHDDTVE